MGPYKYRRNRKDPAHLRPFGGINLGLLGDFWQLTPVREMSLRSNPFTNPAIQSHLAQKTLSMFWTKDDNALREIFELKVCTRIKDTWYAAVIDECRAGALTDDNYNFLHGYPTLVTCDKCLN